MSCTCIIPFFNEGERVLKVLDEVIKIENLKEIICVDDGSTDGASEIIAKRYSGIKIIRNPKNLGKAEAIKTGVEHVKSEYVLLLDADLRNFNFKEIEQAMEKTLEKKVDMVVLKRINTAIIIKLNRGNILLSGERILKKVDLQKILEGEKSPKGYQLEFGINKYMVDNSKSVFWMPSSALNTYPQMKRGFVKGLVKIISMQVNILSYVGLRSFIFQELFFCRKKLI